MALRVFGLITFLFLQIPFATGQEQPAVPPLTTSIDVELVNVDVVVTDARGHHVRGLTKDDFAILENGHAQPITHFAEYRDPHALASPAQNAGPSVSQKAGDPAPDVRRQRRAIVLFLERTHLTHNRRLQFFPALSTFLHTTMEAGDIATIVTWDNGLMLVRQLATSDQAKLDVVLDQLGREAESLLPNPYQTEMGDAAWTSAYLADATEFFAAHGGETTALDARATIDPTVWLRKIQRSTENKLRAVIALTRAMGQIDARRILILGTRRIPVPEVGKGALAIATDQRRHADRIGTVVDALTDAANANGVTIYPFVVEDTLVAPDVTEPSILAKTSAAPLNVHERGLLNDVARGTGGVLSSNAIESAISLPAVSEDLQFYYSLAYRATGEPGHRTIVVKGKRPGLVVRSRTSYVLKADDTRIEDRVIGALFGETPRSTFSISVEPADRRALKVRIPIRALTPVPEGDGYRFTFTVLVAASGLRGVAPPFRETKSFRAPAAELEKARSAFFTYEAQLETDDAVRRVAIGVFDASSKDYGVTAFELRE